MSTFDLDAAVGETNSQPFRFTWGSQEFELPAAMSLPVDRLLKIVDSIENISAADPDQIASVLKLLVDDEMLARLSAARPLSIDGLMKLMSAWMADQGGALGKSPASPASSASMARPSKRTSRSTRARKTS